ncbi:MAG: ferritin family protein [Candidatus Cloacimonadaceae bacterium]|nr:ferritin family protein [Candidatus Cloacimonadota bacterium]MDX9949901.1 ferritin family protein [Candidatus Syntrophosphaera sp.]NLN84611.1 ferritin family protein [Candidatus Cloacimonadota bacterium]
MKTDMLEAIRKAMQGEKDSVTLYEKAAAHADETDVKEFFLSRAQEERGHFNYLLKYHQEISAKQPLSDPDPELGEVRDDDSFFSEDFVRRIGEDQFLFSAISTALLLEKDAFDHYNENAANAQEPQLKKFFELLAKWEMLHYDELLRVQQEAERFYWSLNAFEPF